MQKINFYLHNIKYTLKDKRKIRGLLNEIILKEKKNLVEINIILTDDLSLLDINKKYLNHNTLTDTITFPYNTEENDVWGDVYISIDRIKENAKKYKVKMQTELVRVIIHGTLHLCGYKDKENNDSKNDMINKQEDYLKLYIN